VQGKDIVEVNEKLEGPQGKRVGLSVLRDEEEREFSVEVVHVLTPLARDVYDVPKHNNDISKRGTGVKSHIYQVSLFTSGREGVFPATGLPV